MEENKKNNEEMNEKSKSDESTGKDKKKADAKAEDAALERVLKALNLTKSDLEDLEKQKKSSSEMIEYDVTPTIVKINGRAMPCKGKATRAEVEQILATVGARRHRLLQEALGKTTLGELIGSRFDAKLVEVHNVAGEKVSNA